MTTEQYNDLPIEVKDKLVDAFMATIKIEENKKIAFIEHCQLCPKCFEVLEMGFADFLKECLMVMNSDFSKMTKAGLN